MPGNRAEGLFDAYVRVVETGEPWSTETAYTHEGVDAYMRLVAARAGDGFAVTFADLSERRRAEERLRESEERFRSVFEAIDEGFCIIECLFDDAGRSVDYRFLQANPAFERQSGLVDIVGRTARELVPELEPFWFETYGRVALTGEATRLENHAEPMGRWFDVYASRVGDASSRRVALVFTDITERKQAEARFAISAANDTFRVHLGDTLRVIADPVAIQAEAARVLGEHLHAHRVAYFEISGSDYAVERDYARDVQTLRGHFLTEVFGPQTLAAYRAGRVLVCHNVQTDPLLEPSQRAAHAAIQIGAFIGVPLVKDGQFVAGLTVHQNAPRTWTDDEVALVVEAAERTLAAVIQARAEAALRASEEQYRALTELSSQMVWMLEADGRIAYLSQEWFAYTGASREALHEQGWVELLHPDDQARISAEFEQALVQGETYEMELRLRIRDGSYRWNMSRARPITEGGRIARWFGVTFDIHERKVAEAVLAARAAQDAYRLRLADALRPLSDAREVEGVATRVLGEQLGADRVVYFEMLGPDYVVERDYSPEVPSLVGRHPIDSFGPALLAAYRAGQIVIAPDIAADESLGPVEQATYAALQIGANVGVPLVKDGRFVAGLSVETVAPRAWTAEEVALIEETAERTWAAVERARAETRLQALYAREQELRQQAEEANRLKDEFLATVSHELRTPLTALLGYAELLQRRKRDEAYVARTVAKMLQSAKTQAQLIEDLLDISRITSGKLRLEPEPVSLLAVIYDAVDTLRPMLDAKGIRLQLDLQPEEDTVMGDPNRLQQVLWNLLSNAAKFTPAGGTVMVMLEHTKDHAQIRVRDTGQGIAPEFLPFVFDRFRQADGTSQRSHNGLGLGLAIVRHLVELHGGVVTVVSTGLGQGTTFTVRLPLASQRIVQGDGAEAEGEERARELTGLRLLVVDDQPAVLDMLAELLAADGAAVEACASAEEALARLRAAPPDVLISDIAMPGRDGYWLIEQVRRLPAQAGGAVPAIALTAYVQLEDRLRVLAAGYQQYVPKPVDSAELRDVIGALTTPDGSGGTG